MKSNLLVVSGTFIPIYSECTILLPQYKFSDAVVSADFNLFSDPDRKSIVENNNIQSYDELSNSMVLEKTTNGISSACRY